MYVENFSHAHVTAKTSFSIWAHLLSVSVIDRDAYATGHQVELLFCIKTAPRPYDEASALIFVGAPGSSRCRTVGLESSFLMSANAFSCAGPHSQLDFLLSSCLMGCVISAKLGENLPNWFTMPINWWEFWTICCRLYLGYGCGFIWVSPDTFTVNNMSQELQVGFPEFALLGVQCHSRSFNLLENVYESLIVFFPVLSKH